MTLTAKDVAEITRLLEESHFDELSLELDGLKLTLRRNGVPASLPASEPDLPMSEPGPAPTVVPPSQPRKSEAAAAIEAQTLPVTAPLLGTFYRAPKPGAPPFVAVGSAVEEDTIIGIIEVMKLMNTVRAGTRGRVLEILAQDGALVEYGETLMRIGEASET